MGKWNESSSHQGYIDQKKASRPLLSMMTKIRATQTLGSTLCDCGKHQNAYELFKKTIEEMLKEDMQYHFTLDQVRKLKEALRDAAKTEKAQDKAWSLRSVIDTVYDICVNQFNAVGSQKPPNLHSQIKDTIQNASTDIDSGNFQAGLDKYTGLLKQIKNNRKYKEIVSPAALRLVDESIDIAESSENKEQSAVKARESLDRVYNEIRLPDVYSPSSGPQSSMKEKGKLKNQSLLMIDFRQEDGSLFPYNIQSINDKVMNGRSESHVELLSDEKYLMFSGTVSRVNRGGFASFRIVPSCKEEMNHVLKDVKGFTVEVKNVERFNKRYKFQLANEAHLKSFNWQSEFIVEPNSDFETIFLDVSTFWPTMFGHVLSSPGNVDFDKVDCLGIMLSHCTVDGKDNPDFHEGAFGLAVRSISIVK